MEKQENIQSEKLMIHWKILAFLLPFYLVYGPFSPDDKRLIAKSVWKYMMAGFIFYILATLTFILTQKA